MTRRALLIGAETFKLEGVGHDVEAMDAALTGREFAVRRCEGDGATRDGILGAYRRLIADTAAGDVALVYYSGHGGYAVPPDGEHTRAAGNQRQFIVPTDFRKPDGDDFRGITAVELSVLLAELTEKTRNAVVVLDCCHSAMMSRDLGEAHIRQLPDVVRADLDAHHRRQIAAGLRIDLPDPTGNRLAVRMVACAAEESAHELPRADGPGRYGLFTRELIRALDEASGTRVSWSWVIARARHLVQQRIPHQRPGVEGPFDRVLFEADADDLAGSLPVTGTGDGRARIAAAALLGVQAGDVFAIMPGSASGPADEGRIATVRIDHVDLTAASGRLAFDRPRTAPGTVPRTVLAADVRAYRMTAVAPRIPVQVPASLAPAVGGNAFVRVSEPDEDAPITVVESAGGALTVHDRIGPLHRPRLPGPAADKQVVDDLNRIAKATILRGIREESRATFNPRVTLEWGRVRGGEAHPLPPAGGTVHTGDLVYFRIRNDAQRPLYVSLVDIGVSYRITVLTDLDPAGVKIAAGEEFVFGGDDWDDRLNGVELTWPTGLDPGSPRPETVLGLITSEPQDVSPLQQQGVRGRNQGSPLTDVLDYFGGGASRDFRRPALFRARSFEFTLDPAVRH
jgi:hypothetical protein